MIKGNVDSDKILSVFSFIPIHPNNITLLSILLSIIGLIVFQYNPLYSIILFAFAFFIDAIDGVVARAKNLVSNKGAFLDGISDRIVEFFLILIFIIYFHNDLTILLLSVFILFFGTTMTSFVKAYCEHKKIMKNEDATKMKGLFERAERVILLFISLISMVYFQEYLIYLLTSGAILSIVTFGQRVYIVMSYNKEL